MSSVDFVQIMTFKSMIQLIQMGDREIINTFKWLNDDYLRKMFLLKGNPTFEEHINYWEECLNDESQKNWSIYYDKEHVGNCGAKNINLQELSVELWIYLGEDKYRGQHIGTHGFKLLMDEVIKIYQCKTLYVHVIKENKPAIRMYENLGFAVQNEPLDDLWLKKEENIVKMILSVEKYE